jgi:hypothetical protein
VPCWQAPSRPRDFASDDSRERSQKALKRLTSARSDEQMQMRTYVREIVDPNAEPARHVSECLAHGLFVPSKVQRTPRTVTAEDDVHRSAGTDGALELASTATDGASVLRSCELGPQLTGKKRPLHERTLARWNAWGNVYLGGESLSWGGARLPRTVSFD